MAEHWKDAELARDVQHYRKMKDQILSKAGIVAIALVIAFFASVVCMIVTAVSGGDGIIGVAAAVMPWVCTVLMLVVVVMNCIAMSFEDEARSIKREMGELPDCVFEYRTYKKIDF